jgi:hypothetical protein
MLDSITLVTTSKRCPRAMPSAAGPTPKDALAAKLARHDVPDREQTDEQDRSENLQSRWRTLLCDRRIAGSKNAGNVSPTIRVSASKSDWLTGRA